VPKYDREQFINDCRKHASSYISKQLANSFEKVLVEDKKEDTNLCKLVDAVDEANEWVDMLVKEDDDLYEKYELKIYKNFYNKPVVVRGDRVEYEE
jgi:hypothetical protein